MQSDSPIRWLRKNVFAVTQEQLAVLGGVSRPRVTRYESGGEPPPYEFIQRLRGAARERGLQLDDAWFFEVPSEHPANARPADEDYHRKDFGQAGAE